MRCCFSQSFDVSTNYNYATEDLNFGRTFNGVKEGGHLTPVIYLSTPINLFTYQ